MTALITWTLVAVAIPLLIYCYFWMKKKHLYWTLKKVAHEKPIPILGNLLPVLSLSSSFDDIYFNTYNTFPNDKVVGLYEMLEPVLIIRDLELIGKILVKDFQHFVDHPSFSTESSTISTGLFSLTGNYWRSVRYKISPSFTSGKLKFMFPQLLICSENMIEKLKTKKYECDIKSHITSLSLDILATSIFGIEMSDEKSRKTFEAMSSKVFETGNFLFMKQVFITLFPSLSNKLGFRFSSPDVEKYFFDLPLQTIYQRISHDIQRNDYLQHLVKLKEKGSIEYHEKDKEDNYLGLGGSAPHQNIEITDKLLVGLALDFLLAGFQPIVDTCVYAIFELAQNQHVQQMAREEIKTVLAKHGEYSLASLKEMTYLDQCIQETLRLHPIAQFLNRRCTKAYTTPDGLKIEKGMRVIVSVKALHLDPQHFTEPDCFKPERFSPDAKPSNAYLPFGDGPRICIGMRFALMECKLAIAKLIENFKFTINKKTKLPLSRHNISIFPTLTTKLIIDLVETD